MARAVLALAAVSLLLRTGALDAGYWIDEAISVGIASHDLVDIPWVLRLDGSPPLYYLLLHGWMQLVGPGEAATRSLSLIFAVLAVPAAWWAGRALFDRRAGVLAAAGAAGCPFLTQYAQETRMYSLVAVLSLLACGSFVLAFVHGRRGHLPLLVVWITLLLYTHTWAPFAVAGMAVAWLLLWRSGRTAGRDGALVAGAVLVLYSPWLPSLLFQAANTGAPWSTRPSPLLLLAVPGALFGYAAAPVLVAAVASARRPDWIVRLLAAMAAAGAAFAWLGSPAWSPRYLAVLFGPLLLALAGTLRRGTRWTAAALACVAAIWLLSGPPEVKSNVRAVAARAAIGPGDLVVSTQPEQVPALHRYLPVGVVYVTPLGVVPDPGVVDWRDAAARLRFGRAERVLIPLLRHVAPGRRVLLVTPVARRSRFEGPWARIVRRRTREWRAALRAHVRFVGRVRALPRGRSGVRAELFEVR